MNYAELDDRELDARVAEKIFRYVWTAKGFLVSPDCDPISATEGQSDPLCKIPRYSENVFFAFEVVEAMRERGFAVTMDTEGDGWVALFWSSPDDDPYGESDEITYPSLPRAICEMALYALNAGEEK